MTPDDVIVSGGEKRKQKIGGQNCQVVVNIKHVRARASASKMAEANLQCEISIFRD